MTANIFQKDDTQQTLDALDERQETIFARIKELQHNIQATGEKYGLSSECLQGLVEVKIIW